MASDSLPEKEKESSSIQSKLQKIDVHLDKNVIIFWYLPYAAGAILITIFLLALSYVGVFQSPFTDIFGNPLSYLLALLFIIALFFYIYFTLYYKLFTYSIDEINGIVIRSGILNRKRIVIPFEKVQNINTRRNIFETMLGICTLTIETASGKDIGEGVIPGISMKDRENLIQIINEFSAKKLMSLQQKSDSSNGKGKEYDDRPYRVAIETDISGLKQKNCRA